MEREEIEEILRESERLRGVKAREKKGDAAGVWAGFLCFGLFCVGGYLAVFHGGGSGYGPNAQPLPRTPPEQQRDITAEEIQAGHDGLLEHIALREQAITSLRRRLEQYPVDSPERDAVAKRLHAQEVWLETERELASRLFR